MWWISIVYRKTKSDCRVLIRRRGVFGIHVRKPEKTASEINRSFPIFLLSAAVFPCRRVTAATGRHPSRRTNSCSLWEKNNKKNTTENWLSLFVIEITRNPLSSKDSLVVVFFKNRFLDSMFYLVLSSWSNGYVFQLNIDIWNKSGDAFLKCSELRVAPNK